MFDRAKDILMVNITQNCSSPDNIVVKLFYHGILKV